MASEQASAVERMEESAADDRKKLVKAAQEDINKAVTNERTRATNLLKDNQKKWEGDTATMLENHKSAVEQMVSERSE